MIYKAVEVIWIFSVGRVDRTGTKGTIRGPRGNENSALVWSSNYVSSQKVPQYLLKFSKAPLDGAVHRTFLSTALYLLVSQRFFIHFLNFLKCLQKFCLTRLFLISQICIIISHLHFELALSVLFPLWSYKWIGLGWDWDGLGSLCGAIV